jgi:hypothetical protein
LDSNSKPAENIGLNEEHLAAIAMKIAGYLQLMRILEIVKRSY